MNSFPKADVLAACAQYGPQLNLVTTAGADGTPLDGIRLMIAISFNESTFGANCGPRHEPAYDNGGSYATGGQIALLSTYGSAAACSYGPWQMMFGNFVNATPTQLLTSLDACAQQFVRFFNSYVIHGHHAASISDIGQIWNGGHVSANPSPGVMAYCTKLQTAYDQAVAPPPAPVPAPPAAPAPAAVDGDAGPSLEGQELP